MRVLYWTELFWPSIGGVEVLSEPLLAALTARGHEFTVITSHGNLNLPDQDRHAGIPIYRYPFQAALAGANPGQIHRLLREVVQLKRAVRPQLIHVQFSDPSVFFHLHTADAQPAPTLVSLHVAPPAPSGGDSLLGRAFRSAAWVTAPSEAILADVHAYEPETRGRSSVIYPGLVEPALAPAPLPFDEPLVLCAGRLVVEKGFDVALAAWALLRDRSPRARLIIAGDGPERAALEKQAGDLGSAAGVDFLSWVPPEELPALINRATIVLVPSRWREAFGLIALQAAQMARPVVATRVGGLPETVREGETGLLVEREASAAMAGALSFLLQHPETARQMGQEGRRRAHAVFGWEQSVAAHDQLYRQIAEGFVHGRPVRAG